MLSAIHFYTCFYVLPLHSFFPNIPVFHQGSHQYQCPFHISIHSQPIQLHTKSRLYQLDHVDHEIHVWNTVWSLTYCAFNLSITVNNAFCAGMARIGLTITTGPLRFAAFHLIPSKTSLAVATAKRALPWTHKDSHKQGEWKEWWSNWLIWIHFSNVVDHFMVCWSNIISNL